jgi:Spy/CpxP family protein refolding chaperone
MTRVRWTVAVVVVALVTGSWLIGADTDPIKLRGQLPMNWKKLGLTDEQVQQVYKIEGTYRAKIDDLKKQITDLQKMEKAELEKVLTPAQKDRLREILTGEIKDGKDKDGKDKDGKDKDGKDKDGKDKDGKDKDKAKDK